MRSDAAPGMIAPHPAGFDSFGRRAARIKGDIRHV